MASTAGDLTRIGGEPSHLVAHFPPESVPGFYRSVDTESKVRAASPASHRAHVAHSGTLRGDEARRLDVAGTEGGAPQTAPALPG